MKNKRIITLFVLLSVFYSSCKNRNTGNNDLYKGSPINYNDFGNVREPVRNNNRLHEIDLTNSFSGINESLFDFTKLLNNYELFFLETTDSCLIGEIKKVIPIDSFLLVLDSFIANKICLFDRNGKFIRQIGNVGRGPGEYIQATDCYYDHNKKQIIIYDQFNSEFLFYDLMGNYSGNKKFTFRFIQFTMADKEYVYKNLLDNEHLKEINDHSLCIGSDSVQVEYVCLPILKFAYANGKLHRLNDTVATYGIPFCDTIYHYTRGTLYPQYHLKFSDRTHLPTHFDKNAGYDYMQFRKKYPSNKYTYFNGDFVETDNYVHFSVNYPLCYQFYYHKSKKQLFGGVNLLNNGDSFEKMLMFHNPTSNFGEYFISSITADDIFNYLNHTSDNAKQQLLLQYPALRKLKAEDNPVLFFYRLK